MQKITYRSAIQAAIIFVILAFTFLLAGYKWILPLVVIASFQPDFQHTYPQFKFWKMGDVFGLSKFQMTLIYEFFYGLDFISVELMFRGALVIGMASVLGKDAVLPMAVTYVFIHFGKPAGETVSSFFGGYILGVIALRRQNIFGGIVIHIGMAYLMEIAAVMQHIIKFK